MIHICFTTILSFRMFFFFLFFRIGKGVDMCKKRSLSSDSIFSIIFSFLFKGIQSSTAYNDLISYVP